MNRKQLITKIFLGMITVGFILVSAWWILGKYNCGSKGRDCYSDKRCCYSEARCSALEKKISNSLNLESQSCKNDSDCKPIIFYGNWVSHCVNKNEDTRAIESSAEEFLHHCRYIGVAPIDIECCCNDNKCAYSRKKGMDSAR